MAAPLRRCPCILVGGQHRSHLARPNASWRTWFSTGSSFAQTRATENWGLRQGCGKGQGKKIYIYAHLNADFEVIQLTWIHSSGKEWGCPKSHLCFSLSSPPLLKIQPLELSMGFLRTIHIPFKYRSHVHSHRQLRSAKKVLTQNDSTSSRDTTTSTNLA